MRITTGTTNVGALLALCHLAPAALADQPPTREGVASVTAAQYSRCAGRTFPTRVFWGDTDHHTAVSVDAGTRRLGLRSRGRPVAPPGHRRVRQGRADGRRAARGARRQGAELPRRRVITTWVDPDFDAGAPAFHYARVIEIPTPRWTAYDAKRFGVPMADNVP